MTQTDVNNRRKNGKKFDRNKRKIPFVDFTPMVDLAFLLITFFMLTTAMSRPTVMELNMPEDKDETSVSFERMLTIIADGKHVLVYNGDEYDEMITSNYSESGIRMLLYDNLERVNSLYAGKKHLICIIKFTENATYQNMVDLLDEMEITNVLTYAIQDLTEIEKVQILITGNK